MAQWFMGVSANGIKRKTAASPDPGSAVSASASGEVYPKILIIFLPGTRLTSDLIGPALPSP